jgi:hypothetical protein
MAQGAGRDHVGHHRGVDGAGGDRVDPDAVGPVLLGRALGQADDGVLGGVVRGAAGSADQSADRGAVHDRPGALAAHPTQLVLHRRPDPPVIEAVEPVDVAGLFLGDAGVGNLDAGIVERRIEPPERRHGLGNRGRDLVLVGDIAGEGEHLVPGRGQIVGGRLGSVGVEVDQRHGGAGLRECMGGGQPMPELAPVTSATFPVNSRGFTRPPPPHVYGSASPNGPRYPVEKVETYDNRILLCPAHDTKVDARHGRGYTAADLFELKKRHGGPPLAACELGEATFRHQLVPATKPATRMAFAITVRAGLTPPLVGCRDASATQMFDDPQRRP